MADRFEFSKKQEDFITADYNHTLDVAEGTPRSGKTTACVIRYLRFLNISPDTNHLIVGATQTQAFRLAMDSDGNGLLHLLDGSRIKHDEFGDYLEAIGAAGLLLIKNFEGCRLKAYKPVATEKYWTIGWGHYGPDVKEGQTITQAEADTMLVADCQRFADAVDDPTNCPMTAQLNANQRDALISFAFNCGAGCLRTLCRGRSLSQICEAMSRYNLSGGKPLAGLTRRRKAEQTLFNTPVSTEIISEGEEDVTTYKYLKDIPEKFRPIIDKLMTAGIIQGDGSDPTGNGDVINLTHEQVRTLVFVYRGGGFDAKLRASGLTTAVQ